MLAMFAPEPQPFQVMLAAPIPLSKAALKVVADRDARADMGLLVCSFGFDFKA